MLGDALKFSFDPEVQKFDGKTESTFYFPEGRWCQLYPKKDVPCSVVNGLFGEESNSRD